MTDEAPVIAAVPADDATTAQRLALLSKEEKVIVLVGLFLLQGSGQVSEKKISALQLIISHLDFSSDKIVHRDPTDIDLTLAEKTAWVISVLKNNFADNGMLTEDELVPLFKEVTKSLDKNLKNEPAPEEKAQRIIDGLKKLGDLDDPVTDREKDLIAAFKQQSKFVPGLAGKVMGLAFVLTIAVTTYTYCGEVQAFFWAMVAAMFVSLVKWCWRSLTLIFV